MALTMTTRKAARNMSQQSERSETEENMDIAFLSYPVPKNLTNMGTKEEMSSVGEVYNHSKQKEDLASFSDATVDEKLNKLMKTMTHILQVHTELSGSIAHHEYHLLHDTDGLEPRLATLQEQVDNNSASLSQLATKKEMKELKEVTKEAKMVASSLKDWKDVVRKKELELVKSSIRKTMDEATENAATNDELQQLRCQMARMQGVLGRQEKQIATLNNKITDLTIRSMDSNFTITGWREPRPITPDQVEKQQEDCHQSVVKFLAEKLKLRLCLVFGL